MESEALLQTVQEMQSSLKRLELCIISSATGKGPRDEDLPGPLANNKTNVAEHAISLKESFENDHDYSNQNVRRGEGHNSSKEDPGSLAAPSKPAQRSILYIPHEYFLGSRIPENGPLPLNSRFSQDLKTLLLGSLDFKHFDEETIIQATRAGRSLSGPAQTSDCCYYKPLFKVSMIRGFAEEDRYSTTKGAGRPNILPIWQVLNPQSETLASNLSIMFPYSATPPLSLGPQKIMLSGTSFETMRESLGNLWSLPWDHRLHFTFQSVDVLSSCFFENRPSKLVAQTPATSKPHELLAALTQVGGSFTVYDFDEYGSFARYGLAYRYTAADAEEVALRITPSLFSVEKSFSDLQFFFEQSPFTAPWRRLVICRGLREARLTGPLWFQSPEEVQDVLAVHLSTHHRTSPELDETNAPLVFHICWLQVNPDNLGHQDTSGRAMIQVNVKSYTIVSLIEPYHIYKHSTTDSRHWTLLLLTPKEDRHQPKAGATKGIEGIEAATRVATTLSAINQALSWASYSWVEVVEFLELSLNFQNNRDFFTDSADFAYSRRCFHVINTVDDHENLIADTLAQWDWYRSMNNIRELARQDDKIDKWLDSIATSYFRLKDSEARLKALRERARSRRDGLFSLTAAREARESRLLNENVRLLTYATVFYLPLAFSSSLWTINSMFGTGITGFAVITTVLALLTYAIIFVLLKSDSQFSRAQQARLSKYFTRRSDSRRFEDDDDQSTDPEPAHSGSEEEEDLPRQRKWWQRKKREDV